MTGNEDMAQQELLRHIDERVEELVALRKRAPGEVNGQFGKFLTFMRQIQGAVVVAAFVGGTTWAISAGNRLESIETKIDSPNYALPGSVPKGIYDAEMAAMHMRMSAFIKDIDKAEARSAERDDDQQVEIRHLQKLIEDLHSE